MFLMWLGEQITARGIGNGISLIIFRHHCRNSLRWRNSLPLDVLVRSTVIVGVIVMAATIAFVVFMERALRKIIINIRAVKLAEGDGRAKLAPAAKVNPAGVIPAIFASSLLLLPTTVSTFSGSQTGPVMSTILDICPGQPLYLAFFTAMIVFFAYFTRSMSRSSQMMWPTI